MSLHTLRRTLPCLAAAALVGLATLSPARADSTSRNLAAFASGPGNIIYLALGVGLPALDHTKQGQNRSLRVADALGTSVLITEALKAVTREKRPDSNEHDSFPSGHATAAFAVAATESAFHPRQAGLWYLGATLISASRVRLNRHFTQDVVAGAAIGYYTANWELSQPRGLILSPIIQPNYGGGLGMQVSGTF